MVFCKHDVLVCTVRAAVKCEKRHKEPLVTDYAVCESRAWPTADITQTVSKHRNTYADPGEVLCFLFITFKGATQAVWVSHLTFHLLPHRDL